MSPACSLSLKASFIGSSTLGIAALFLRKSGSPSPGPLIYGMLGSCFGAYFLSFLAASKATLLSDMALERLLEISDLAATKVLLLTE